MNSRAIELPFSQEISHTHGTICSLVSWLETELQRQARYGMRPERPLLGPIRVLRRLLSDHFYYEEDVGFSTLSGDLVPDDFDSVERLILQHANFRERMLSIEQDLETATQYDVEGMAQVVEDLRCLFQDLHQHDLEENRLLQRLVLKAG